MTTPGCPLCGTNDAALFHEDSKRPYHRCRHCALVFVPPPFWLTPEEEKAEYDLHQNDPEDAGYRRFLSRLADPLMQRLPEPARGLDFGCGPGPALADLLRQGGHRVDLYDPFYVPNPPPEGQTYDFICATEVVEHLRDPAMEWQQLFRWLRPGGWLAVMTKLVLDRESFRNWHYIRDLTHIAFYCPQTFAWIGRAHKATVLQAAPDVILFQLS